MQETTFLPDQTSIFSQTPNSDAATVIPHLILDLESDNINIHIPALKQLLKIILDNHQNKNLALKYKLYPILNKFAGSIVMNEEFLLSTTILHVIGVRSSTNDKHILTGAVTQSMILSLFAPDEKTSKSGSIALEELIDENEIIRNALLTNGFLLKVQHAFTNSSLSSSSSSQTESSIPFHAIFGLVDIVHKLVTTADDIRPIAILIPLLNELKNNVDKEIKKKSENILSILNSQGINSISSEYSKEKDEKIQQLEESNRQMDEESAALKVENTKLKEEIEKIKFEYPQVIPHEYNVAGGLLGLGQDTLVDLLSEMIEFQDAVQFVGVNKNTLQLKNHPRFKQIIESINNNSDLENPDPTGQRVLLEQIGDLLWKAVALKKENLSVSLNKAISEGIHRVEVRFEKCTSGKYSQGAVGIMKADYQIPYPCGPRSEPHRRSMLNYYGHVGNVYFNGISTYGNVKFKDGELIAMELNADVGTLHFFVDEIQQPIFMSGINEAVKFYFYIYNKDSSFSIVSLKKLQIPTAKTLPNEKALQW
ncbi:MAG: hypothetical protein EZS28_012889 [Streblomastix strix]|uniref:SPRY domain-containing protein n=1 Tax=Streblomastix strix TaxID=222440 RepID=A0A5J4WAB1_9EUKA|nr:MAG: hypothetical protein EZS28_012889 [Streblomastix strix]